MIQSIMAILNLSQARKTSLKLSLILTLSTSIGALAAADDIYDYDPLGTGIKPSYSSSQALPLLTPDQIARDVEVRYDSLTGRNEYLAQDFDPFEQDTRMAGSARLRSSVGGVSRDGAAVNGGAYLDVMVMYTSASRDSWDVRGFEHSVYMNGQPVDVMNYNAMTLDCTSDITRVAYDDSYYRGDRYGRVGGIFRPFPRYRGASEYYRQCDQIRYGAWRGQRDNYTSYTGYDYRQTPEWVEFVDRERGRRNTIANGNNNNSNRVEENLTPEEVRQRFLRRDLALRLRDQEAISSRNVVRADRLGDRRLVDLPSGVDPRPISSGGINSGLSAGSGTVSEPVNTPAIQRPNYGGRTIITRPANPELGEILRNREDLARISRGSGVPGLSNATPRLPDVTPRISTPVPARPVVRSVPTRRTITRPDTSRPTISRPNTPGSSTSRPTTSRPTTSRPTISRPSSRSSETRTSAPTSRPSPPTSRPSTSRPTPSRPSTSTPSAPRRTISRPSTPKPSRPAPSRPVNRTFGGSSNRNRSTPPRSRRYYPGNTSSYSSNRCVKEERVTLHIPAERLEAARFDGLSLVLLDKDGGDIPVYIPPNYIAGYIQANPYLKAELSPFASTGGNSTAPGYPQGSYPTNPGN